VCWWPAARCQAWWGRLIAPDAYARRRDPDGEVDPSSTTPHPPAADPHGVPLERDNELAAATGITTPVLLYAGDPRPAGPAARRQLPVPVASSNPACGQPADPVWLPTSNLHRTPGSGRRRAAPPS
jgi:hypothetical protein